MGMAWVYPPLQGLIYWMPFAQGDALGCHRVAPLVLGFRYRSKAIKPPAIEGLPSVPNFRPKRVISWDGNGDDVG